MNGDVSRIFWHGLFWKDVERAQCGWFMIVFFQQRMGVQKHIKEVLVFQG